MTLSIPKAGVFEAPLRLPRLAFLLRELISQPTGLGLEPLLQLNSDIHFA